MPTPTPAQFFEGFDVVVADLERGRGAFGTQAGSVADIHRIATSSLVQDAGQHVRSEDGFRGRYQRVAGEFAEGLGELLAQVRTVAEALGTTARNYQAAEEAAKVRLGLPNAAGGGSAGHGRLR